MYFLENNAKNACTAAKNKSWFGYVRNVFCHQSSMLSCLLQFLAFPRSIRQLNSNCLPVVLVQSAKEIEGRNQWKNRPTLKTCPTQRVYQSRADECPPHDRPSPLIRFYFRPAPLERKTKNVNPKQKRELIKNE